LVAFGAANSCSTGFGYAPAPQARLRFRLAKIHKAKVELVDEYKTSQMCSICSNRLSHAVSTHYDRETGIGKVVQLHAVLRCPVCRNAKGAPLFHHRDFNAAKNILSCYLSAASGNLRPAAFSRVPSPGSASS
jgi:transposase